MILRRATKMTTEIINGVRITKVREDIKYQGMETTRARFVAHNADTGKQIYVSDFYYMCDQGQNARFYSAQRDIINKGYTYNTP